MLPEDVVYLELDDILGFYADIFEISLKQAENHLLHWDKLESALERPRQYAYYRGADLATQAACIGHAIAESQCFLDGNKRTASIAIHSFLRFNLCDLTCPDEQLASWVLHLSQGSTIEEIANQL